MHSVHQCVMCMHAMVHRHNAYCCLSIQSHDNDLKVSVSPFLFSFISFFLFVHLSSFYWLFFLYCFATVNDNKNNFIANKYRHCT